MDDTNVLAKAARCIAPVDSAELQDAHSMHSATNEHCRHVECGAALQVHRCACDLTSYRFTCILLQAVAVQFRDHLRLLGAVHSGTIAAATTGIAAASAVSATAHTTTATIEQRREIYNAMEKWETGHIEVYKMMLEVEGWRTKYGPCYALAVYKDPVLCARAVAIRKVCVPGHLLVVRGCVPDINVVSSRCAVVACVLWHPVAEWACHCFLHLLLWPNPARPNTPFCASDWDDSSRMCGACAQSIQGE
jgi:hypothetical protein